jgi:septum formation protein
MSVLLSAIGHSGEFEIAEPRSEIPIDSSVEVDDAVCGVALAKAKDAAAQINKPDALIIAADTAVVLGDAVVLGKPRDKEEAVQMLKLLSGRTHAVVSGVAFVQDKREHTFCEWTEVKFRKLSDSEIVRYVTSGDAYDKAGAYGIQGGAAIFAESISGDYYNVVGLPLCRLAVEIAGFADERQQSILEKLYNA